MYDWGDAWEGGGGRDALFDMISVMVLECLVCDERSGLCRVYVKAGTNVYESKSKIL